MSHTKTLRAGGSSSTYEMIGQNFTRHQIQKLQSARARKQYQDERERLELEAYERRKLKEAGLKAEDKIVNVEWTDISAAAVETRYKAVSLVMQYLSPSTHKKMEYKLRNAVVIPKMGSGLEIRSDKDVIQDSEFVIVADKYLFQKIIAMERPHGISTVTKDGKVMHYHTAKESGSIQVLGETKSLKSGLPLARLSSVVAYKNKTWIDPKAKNIGQNHPGLIPLAQAVKDIREVLYDVNKDLKVADATKDYVRKTYTKLSKDQQKNWDLRAELLRYGPRRLFTYSNEKGCDNNEEWGKTLGTPRQPTRQDYEPSARAYKDNSWKDNSIPVKMGSQAVCIPPSETKVKDGNLVNYAESEDPVAYHHMGELVAMDAKEKPSIGGRTLTDGEIYSDMAFCAPASSIKGNLRNKDNCQSTVTTNVPLSTNDDTRQNKCRLDGGTCHPYWMKPHDKDNKLRQMYYRKDSGFADTEIVNQQEVYAKSKKSGGRVNETDEEDPLARGKYAKRWDDGSMYKTKEWNDIVERMAKLSSGGDNEERDAYLSSMLEREESA